MLKRVLFYTSLICILASCSSLKTAVTGKKATIPAQNALTEKKETKFLKEISMPVESATVVSEKKTPETPVKYISKPLHSSSSKKVPVTAQISESSIELASPIQVKYSVLLNTAVEEVTSIKMFEFIDEWYGTRYRLGGTTKKGIDCSAFSQFLFAAVYGLNLPRTAREQYSITDKVSRTDLSEGDLLFFNTRGGVSHVGVYLQNNKFVHAASSEGVMISDVFDDYWLRRFIGVGRIKEDPVISSGQ
jgi:lipoprotein Spr